MHDGHILTYVQQQRWGIKIPFAFCRFTAKDHFSPLLHRARHLLLHALQRGGVDQRPHGNIRSLSRIAKLDGFHCLAQTIHKAVVDPLLDIDTFRTVTHLSGIDDA
ncbi:Uncharacterised protein [Enterobacter cloacae]|nr:Uncharacterised protein [Enterobacter cloacae]